MSKIKVIIPAYNEEKLLHVIKEIQIQLVKLLLFLTTQLIILLKWQQQLVPPYSENRKGYGYACLKGMEYISNKIKPDIVVF
jgi:glycosyltransferase involved in cell wall biosynthesis